MDKPAVSGGSPQRTRENFLVFGAPSIGEAEINEVIDSLRSGWLGTGPKTARFEDDFRSYIGANHTVALNSCTAALHLSILAAGIKPGDEVITTALTFAATVNTIIHAGATPVMVDVDPKSMNIDPARITEKVTERTKAIVPVHFAGRPCEMDPILEIAEDHHLKVIEDSAHSVEGLYKGKSTGTFGDFGAFSFYVTKNVITGEGGMVTTRHEEDAAKIKMLALHGLSRDAWKRFSDEGYKHYKVVECGYKYNMMDIQAALGIHQLARVEKNWKVRRKIWDCYMEAFSDLPVGLPAEPEPGTRHAHHLFTILIDQEKTGISRDRFLDAMTAENIGVGVHYLSLPEHPYYQQSLAWKPEDYPEAMRIGRQTVSLPISAGLRDEDVEDVVNAVSRIIRHFTG
jgi:dTDP-4-amino-4,6-dideoxygalactose transaminase